MRFPKRTVVLMVLALLAFVWMYWRTHLEVPGPTPVQVQLAPPLGEQPLVDGGDR